MELDEVDLNYVLDAIRHQIKTVNWDMSCAEHHECLMELLRIHGNILRKLDGHTAVDKVTTWFKT